MFLKVIFSRVMKNQGLFGKGLNVYKRRIVNKEHHSRSVCVWGGVYSKQSFLETDLLERTITYLERNHFSPYLHSPFRRPTYWREPLLFTNKPHFFHTYTVLFRDRPICNSGEPIRTGNAATLELLRLIFSYITVLTTLSHSVGASSAISCLMCSETLTFSLLMTTQEAFVDSVDQDQTAQNVQSDL